MKDSKAGNWNRRKGRSWNAYSEVLGEIKEAVDSEPGKDLHLCICRKAGPVLYKPESEACSLKLPPEAWIGCKKPLEVNSSELEKLKSILGWKASQRRTTMSLSGQFIYDNSKWLYKHLSETSQEN